MNQIDFDQFQSIAKIQDPKLVLLKDTESVPLKRDKLKRTKTF